MQKQLFVGLLAGAAVTALAFSAAANLWANAPPAPPKCHLGVFCDKNAPKDQGVVIREVEPNSPAASCGLKAGDVVVKIGDKAVKNFEDLAGYIDNCKPGVKCDLWVKRDGKEQKLTCTLAENQVRELPPMIRDFLAKRAAPHSGPYIGIQAQELTAELKNKLGVAADKGCLVADVMDNSPAARAGLKEEDVITWVNDKAVANPQELRDALHRIGSGKEVTLKVVRGKETKEMKCKIEDAPKDLASKWQFDPRGSFWADRFFGDMPRFLDNGSKVQELEKKVQELENHIRELEKKLAKPVK